MTDDQIKTVINGLQCQIEVQKAELRVMRILLGRLLQQSGITEIESRPIDQWLSDQHWVELEKILISYEDKNPSLAARLQALIDEAKRRSGQTDL